MTVKGIECPHCKDRVYSRSVHDFRSCECGKSFVDGGKEYLRKGGNPIPATVDIEIES